MPGRRTCPPVGIDLGTTYSCVAVWQNGRVAIISNDLGCRVTPSYVAFTDTQRLVGEAAKSQAHRNGENTIYDAKRLIGRKFSDTVVQGDMQLWPFKVYKGTADKPVLKVQHEGKTKEYAPQQISSMVLARMKKFAEDFLDGGVTQAVITVPAYFNDAQRSATVEAGKIAGLEVLRIISEPVAAALTYGLQRHHVGKSKVVIYDLGGGTCDVSALEIEGGDFNVLAKDGDTHLGGEDFDRCLVDHFVQEIRKKYRVDLSSDRRARRRLHGAAEVAKRTLSSMDCATVEVDSLIKGDDFFTTITCARFEDLCEDLFQRCMLPVTRCLDAAGLKPHQVDEVVLVGGSTRIPRIQSLLEMLFDGKSLNKTVNPDEAVAHGAAVQAAMLTDTWSSSVIESLRLQDVTPLSLGLRCYGDKFSVVIPRNAKVPASVTLNYTNARDVTDTQSACIRFAVHEGERSVASLNDQLGSFSLHDVPPGPKGSHLFEVTFTIDSDGILTVTSKHKGTDNWKAITIDHSSGRHTEQEVQKMIEEAERYRRADEAVLVKQKAKNDLSEYVYGIKNALRAGLESDLQRFDASALVKSKDRIIAWLESGSDVRDPDEYCSRRSELEALCSCAVRNAINLDTEWRPSDKVMIAAGKELSITIKEAVEMATG